MKPIDWLMSGDTGLSSRTILSVMEGSAPPSWPSTPADPSDFGRCHRLLEHFPLYRLRLAEVVAVYPEWVGLVREWDALTALYLEELPTGSAPRLYARMQELNDEGLIASGWSRTAGGWSRAHETIHED